MIKFFRRIRQSLILENKTGKYFKYAIGEIVLVVIGILIALQINAMYNTSQNNKLKQVYVKNLISDLTKDTIQLNARLKVNENSYLKHSDSLLAIITKTTTTVEDVKNMGQTAGLIGLRTMNTYNTNTLNILTSTGNIDLFEDFVIQEIMELNRLQEYEISVSNGNRDSYFRNFGNYNENYTDSYGTNNLLAEQLWSNVDPIKHAPLYINALTIHNHAVTRYISLTKEIITKTEELLVVMNNLENND
ncbi:DUF6090 family protein [Hanstruepera marina]|uniref:DUF6090 family protein n=1 Tax=Hanstruepera marina TaxID=2873265 RepID=UPI001CA61DCE|nr:DUF6090 family protein [Hanstruepera marina]